MDEVADRVRIHQMRTLAKQHHELRTVAFSWLRGDGEWQRQTREVFVKGNGAAILLYNRSQGTVVLIRQFRLPAFLNGYRHQLIEVPAGMLDGERAELRIIAEVEEETGFAIAPPERLFEAFMSPGSLDETLTFFIAEYDPASRSGKGGGLADEGEDIEVMEVRFEAAIEMMKDGRICDAKTIILLQYAQLHLFRA